LFLDAHQGGIAVEGKTMNGTKQSNYITKGKWKNFPGKLQKIYHGVKIIFVSLLVIPITFSRPIFR